MKCTSDYQFELQPSFIGWWLHILQLFLFPLFYLS